MFRKIMFFARKILGKSNERREPEKNTKALRESQYAVIPFPYGVAVKTYPTDITEDAYGVAEKINPTDVTKDVYAGAEEINSANITQEVCGMAEPTYSESGIALEISASPHATFFTAHYLKPEEVEDLLFLHQSEYLYFIQKLLTQPELISEFIDNEIHHDTSMDLDIPKGYPFVQKFIKALIRPEYEEKNEEYLSVVSTYAKASHKNSENDSNHKVAQQTLLEFFEKNPIFKNTLLANRHLLGQATFLFVHTNAALKLRRSNSDANNNNNNNNNNNSSTLRRTL